MMDFFYDIEKFADSTALIDESSNHYTYKQLLDAADGLSEHIKGRCLAFIVCRNSFESVAGYVGFLRKRIVPLLLGDGLKAELFDALLRQYRPEYVWIPEEMSGQIEHGTFVFSRGGYSLLKNLDHADFALHHELAMLLTTSGSTGSFKLVRQSYKNIISNARSIVRSLGISRIDRPITTLPMNYTYGLSIINSHLSMGCGVVLTDKPLVNKEFWNLLKKHEASTFGGVPYTYEMLKRLRFSNMNLPSVKMLTQAGGKLSLELTREFASSCKEKNINFVVMYGQTEATARMSYLPGELAEIKAGSIGVAIPGGKFWLEDERGQIVHESEFPGELVYQGDNVAMGYAQDGDDLSKGYENGNILKTGDIAKRDADGFYYIVGRKKRFLKLFGNRVSLDEVEDALRNNGHDCACTGDDDHMKIYTTDQSSCETIKSWVSDYTGIHVSAFKVVNIDKIPRNGSGKPLYHSLE